MTDITKEELRITLEMELEQYADRAARAKAEGRNEMEDLITSAEQHKIKEGEAPCLPPVPDGSTVFHHPTAKERADQWAGLPEYPVSDGEVNTVDYYKNVWGLDDAAAERFLWDADGYFRKKDCWGKTIYARVRDLFPEYRRGYAKALKAVLINHGQLYHSGGFHVSIPDVFTVCYVECVAAEAHDPRRISNPSPTTAAQAIQTKQAKPRCEVSVAEAAQLASVAERTIRNWDTGKHTPKDYPGRESRHSFTMFVQRRNDNKNMRKTIRQVRRAKTATEAGVDIENQSEGMEW